MQARLGEDARGGDNRAMNRACTLALLGATGLGVVGPTAAQSVSGVLWGFDGEPVASATVVIQGERSGRLAEVVTDRDGRFSYRANEPLQRLRVRYEAVVVEGRAPGDADGDAQFDLSTTPHWILRGHVVDPRGRPAAGVDVVARDGDGKALGVVTTDADGAYRLRSNQEIADLHVDPLGLAYTLPGPFRAERGVAIDLRLVRDRYTRHSGRVLDLDGEPVENALVVAHAARGARGRQGTRVGWARTGGDGTFELWTSREAAEFGANVGGLRLRQFDGDWRPGRPITLDARRDALVAINASVVDRDGKARGHTFVYSNTDASLPEGRQPLSRSNGSGGFHAMIRIGTPFLVASTGDGPCAVAVGPWTRDAIVLRPAK